MGRSEYDANGAFYDNPSAALGLSLKAEAESFEETLAHYRSASPERPSVVGPPIVRPLTSEEQRERDEAEARYQEKTAELAEIERQKIQEVHREEFEKHRRNFKAAGLSDEAATEKAIDRVQVSPSVSNAGAYTEIRSRKLELMGDGYAEAEAERIALGEQSDALYPEESGEPSSAKDPYLGASIHDIGFDRKRIGSGGSGARGRKRERIVKIDHEHQYDQILSDDGLSRSSEEDRARREMDAHRRRVDQGKGHVGRPLEGNEPKMRVQGRMEPTKVVELHDMTGMDCIPLLDEVHKLLSMARNGAEADAVLEAINDLLIEERDCA